MTLKQAHWSQMDLALVRKMLGSGDLCGCFLSLASRPDRYPRYCFCILHRLRRLLGQLTIHGDLGGLEIFNGMLWALQKSLVTVMLLRNPKSIKSCRLYTKSA